MNQSLDFAAIGTSLANFLKRFHAILYFVLVGIGIGICMITIISIINLSSQADATSEAISSTFDQKTIDRIRQLESRDNTTPIDIPTNQRTNPFVD